MHVGKAVMVDDDVLHPDLRQKLLTFLFTAHTDHEAAVWEVLRYLSAPHYLHRGQRGDDQHLLRDAFFQQEICSPQRTD